MIDLDRHINCPLFEALSEYEMPWMGMRYACLNVLDIYCKIFHRGELQDVIVRKTCQLCKCPREAHAIYQEQTTSICERLGLKAEHLTSGVDSRQLGYTWVPPGIMTSSKIQRYFDKIPQEKVPKVGTVGERHRERQIMYQLPKQDLSLDYCKHIDPQHYASYEDFVTARNEIALDIGFIKDATHKTKCTTCGELIAQSDLAVVASKFGDQVMWHPNCFICSTCDELLVDLTYCVHENKLYCERHYAELLKPRCYACDEEEDAQQKSLKSVSRFARESSYPTSLGIDSPNEMNGEWASDNENENIGSNSISETDFHFNAIPTNFTEHGISHDVSVLYQENEVQDQISSFEIPESTTNRIRNDGGRENVIHQGEREMNVADVNSFLDTSSFEKYDEEQKLSQFNAPYTVDVHPQVDQIDFVPSALEADRSFMFNSRGKHPTYYHDDESESDDEYSPSESEPSSDRTIESFESEVMTKKHYFEPSTAEGFVRGSSTAAAILTDSENNPNNMATSVEHFSDFYDFNASLNRKSVPRASFSPNPPLSDYISKPSTHIHSGKTLDHMGGLSDFFDYNVKMNFCAHVATYSGKEENVHKLSELSSAIQPLDQSREMEKPKLGINSDIRRKLTRKRASDVSLLSPTLPLWPFSRSSRRQLSRDERDDFSDCSDDFDELREEAKYFRRSRSQSRSMGDVFAGTREQVSAISWSKDVPASIPGYREFCTSTGSSDDISMLTNLDGDEYHHFRRFSLYQEYEAEEDPADTNDFMYLRRVESEPFNRSVSVSSISNDFVEIKEAQVREVVENVQISFGNRGSNERKEDEVVTSSENAAPIIDFAYSFDSEVYSSGQKDDREYVGTGDSSELNKILAETIDQCDVEYENTLPRMKTRKKVRNLNRRTENFSDDLLTENTELASSAYEDPMKTIYEPKKEYNWRRNFKLSDDSDDGEASQKQDLQQCKPNQSTKDNFGIDASLEGKHLSRNIENLETTNEWIPSTDTRKEEDLILESYPTSEDKGVQKVSLGSKKKKPKTISSDFSPEKHNTQVVTKDTAEVEKKETISTNNDRDNPKLNSLDENNLKSEITLTKNDVTTKLTLSSNVTCDEPSAEMSNLLTMKLEGALSSNAPSTEHPVAKQDSEQDENSGAYELIKDSSMYPWF